MNVRCWCGNTPPPLANQALDTYCNFGCPGDGNDACGAPGYLSVYYDPTKYVAGTDPALYGPQTIKGVGGYKYQGCYSEATNGRALSALSPAPPTDGFTIELCAAACQGYLYFGMEYSNQVSFLTPQDRDLMLNPFLCYCGNSLGAGSVNQTSSDPSVNGCNMVCTGNAKEYCGGPDRLDLYSLNGTAVISAPTGTSPPATPTSSAGPITVTNLLGYTYLGCYSEATNERALNGYLLPIPAANTSVETCAAACSQYTYFGVEYSKLLVLEM